MGSLVKSSNDQATEDLVILSPLDQIMPRVYVRLILCLPSPGSSEEDHGIIFSALEKGLQNTLAEIPYLGGVVVEGKDKSGKVHIAPGPGVMLRLKTFGDDANMSYQKWKDSHFPLSCLDGLKAPVDLIPLESNSPVMAAQVNILQDGVLLAIGIHHSAMDAAGYATVLKTWASNTKSNFPSDGTSGDEAAKPTSLPKLASNSLDRNPLMKASTAADVDRQADIKNYPQYKLEPTPPPAKDTEDAPIAPTFTLPPMARTLFYFAAPKLAALKFSASPSSSFVSTNDALCALLWSSIARARTWPDNATEGQEPPSSLLGFAVDGRRRLSPPLPPTYLGNVNIYASARLPVSTLSKTTELNSIAPAIRAANAELDNDRIQDVIALVNSLANVTDLKPGFNSFLGPDLAITSWRDMGLIGLDWGAGIGKIEAVRFPETGFDGLCIILPALADGGLEVVVGLEECAMERLKGDETFMAAAEVRCT